MEDNIRKISEMVNGNNKLTFNKVKFSTIKFNSGLQFIKIKLNDVWYKLIEGNCEFSKIVGSSEALKSDDIVSLIVYELNNDIYLLFNTGLGECALIFTRKQKSQY